LEQGFHQPNITKKREDRLEWFFRQADEDLIGEIDDEKTRTGVIVCNDGFRAATFTKHQFLSVISKFKLRAEVFKADESSLFCVVANTTRIERANVCGDKKLEWEGQP